jgi:carbon-monoxide dehydrogenase medium subunit
VKPAPFRYAKARSVEHAVELLGSESDARVLAGGQSLIATLNMRLSSPQLLVDINRIGGLDRIAHKDGLIEIGALVRHAQAERSEVITRRAPLLALAVPHIAHPAIRNRGTIGGSIALADPAAELPACLLALAGEVEIAGPRGRRSVAAETFFKGLFETALGPNDVLTAIRVPTAGPDMRIGFAEFARRHGDYALAGLAACARAENDRLRDVRLAYFGVGGTAVRARRAEAALGGTPADAKSLDEALAELDLDLDPPDDIHASGTMRKHLAGVLLKRVARQLIEPGA